MSELVIYRLTVTTTRLITFLKLRNLLHTFFSGDGAQLETIKAVRHQDI